MSQLGLSDPTDKDLAAAVGTAAEQVHRSLLDNINTGAAVEALLELVAITNKYIKQREESSATNTGSIFCFIRTPKNVVIAWSVRHRASQYRQDIRQAPLILQLRVTWHSA